MLISEFKNKIPMGNFKISSSHGNLIVDTETGVVIECNSSRNVNDYLPNIKKFDVNRYRAASKRKMT